ncbi:MAG: hypothetical protein S4CHLAM20_10430 [Chlamydiia bacterium]|nr:hypothetical protein [Chlamydiia bacterium]
MLKNNRKSLFAFFCLFGLSVIILLVGKMSTFKGKSIQTITQLSLQKEALSSLYLTEVLGLSFDKPTLREDFDLKNEQEKLLSSPIIEKASLNFIDDTHLQVTYKHFTPIALLGDFKNRGIDLKGRIFPIRPFLAPKAMTKVFLGISEIQDCHNITGYKEKTRWDFAACVLRKLIDLEIKGRVSLIDVSKIEEMSLGKNELVIQVDYLKRKDILRLSKRNYLNEVSNYIILCDKLNDESGTLMIDFRFDSCAFIERF